MQLENRGDCVTDLVFDRWFADEYGAEQVAGLEAHLRACARCRLRGELIARERAAFLAKAPTLADNARHARGSRARSRRLQRGAWFSLAAAAAAAALVLAFGPAVRERETASEQEHARAATGQRRKGGFHVGSSDTPTYLALLGRDARSATVYFRRAPSAWRRRRATRPRRARTPAGGALRSMQSCC